MYFSVQIEKNYLEFQRLDWVSFPFTSLVKPSMNKRFGLLSQCLNVLIAVRDFNLFPELDISVYGPGSLTRGIAGIVAPDFSL